MKKHIFALSALFMMASGLNGATVDQVAKVLSTAASTLGEQAFNKNLTTTVQNASLVVWDKAFAQAKTFIIDNSKDLLKKQDPILLDAMAKVEKVNIDFINTIKVIRATLPKAPISKLLTVSNDAKKSVETLYATSFTLPGKNNASALLKSVARFIEDTSKQLYNMLVAQG
jgi:hypothetical protein